MLMAPVTLVFVCSNRIVLVVNRRCGRQIVDFIDFYVEREGDVVTGKIQNAVADKVFDVVARAGKKIVEHQNVVTFLN